MPDRRLTFKVDENLPKVATAFRDAGYEASAARSQGLAGSRTRASVKWCVFVTLDVGFGEIRAYPPDAYPVIIVLRLTRQDKPRILAEIRRMPPFLATEAVIRQLWVVEEHAVRIRGET